MARLSVERMARYQAHLALPDFGTEGQKRLLASRALLIGAGGLGCAIAPYLVAAGIGRLEVVDDDRVDATNLQRQILFGDADVGRDKATAACERLAAINGEVELVARVERVVASNVAELVAGHDVVVDGSDNFATRYVVNDACVLAGIPLVTGSLYRYEGQVTVISTPATGCYRCLFPAAAEDAAPCHDAGVLGSLAGLIGTIQATEALRTIAQGEAALAGRLLLVDARTMRFQTVELRRDPACPLCGEAPTIDRPTATIAPGR